MNEKAPPTHIAHRVHEVLRFDRFYSQRLREASKAAQINEVNEAELGILLELIRWPCSPGWLSWRLGLNPGYLSRNLRRLEALGFITVCRSSGDRRLREVALTDNGRQVARSLEKFQQDAVRNTLEELPVRQQLRLVEAMNVIVEIFERDDLTNFQERCEEGR